MPECFWKPLATIQLTFALSENRCYPFLTITTPPHVPWTLAVCKTQKAAQFTVRENGCELNREWEQLCNQPCGINAVNESVYAKTIWNVYFYPSSSDKQLKYNSKFFTRKMSYIDIESPHLSIVHCCLLQGI